MENSISILNSSSRWVATVASILIQATTGASYTFSIYSPAIKSSQNYDQSTLDTISVFKDIGANFGILSGFLYSAVATARNYRQVRHQGYGGPWVVLALAAAQCFLGYFLMWLSVVGVINQPPVPVMCLFMFVAAHAQSFFNTANVVTAVQNFPDYSGTIVGIMKGFLGISGAMLIQVYLAFFRGKPSTFILMLALLPSTATLSLMFLVRIIPGDGVDDEKKYLNGFSIVALVLAAYLMMIIILENIFEFPIWGHLFTIVVLLLLLSLPLKIAVEAISEHMSHALPVERNSFVHSINSDEPSKMFVASGCCFQTPGSEEYEELPGSFTDSDQSMCILEAMQKLNFWLLFVSMSCGMGSGLATINNMSQIGQSLGYNTAKINTLVALWSIWNFLGRFGAGYISDVLLHRKGWSRPLLIVITLAAMSVGHVIIASGFEGNLYVGTIMVGICYGAQWSLMPTITSEIFGVLHMGTIFNTIGLASPVGTYVLSVWVIGHIYDREAGGSNSCFGVHCFLLSFIILAFVSFLGSLIALTLFLRTRTFYRSVVLRRLHHSFRQ